MRKRLFNQQSEPGSREAATAQRLSVKAKIMMALIVLMLIPQVTWAQIEYYRYNATSGAFEKASVSSYSTLSGSTNVSNDVTLSSGTYVCSRNDVSYAGRLIIDGAVNIILCDGAKLDAWSGVGVNYDATLTIYGQEKGTGQLNAYGYNHNIGTYDQYAGAAIGGYYHNDSQNNVTSLSKCGTIVIHGGIITANSSSSGLAHDAAGIGGWTSDGPRDLTIYGGKVTATGGKSGAGIGGGGLSSNGGKVSIYGGEVIANGGEGDPGNNESDAMGIGPGSYDTSSHPQGTFGTLYIGDNVTCNIGTSSSAVGPQANIANRSRIMSTDYQYALTVAGMPVKASNVSNILGSASSATASFYTATNTLVLNGLEVNGNITSGLDALTIDFSGDNRLASSIGSGSGNFGYIKSTKDGATLTLRALSSGTGSSLYISNDYSYEVVGGFSSITLEDGVYASYDSPFQFNSTNKRYERGGSPLQSMTYTTTKTYMLWVGSVGDGFSQALEGDLQNSNNITAGKVNYNSSENTLTLEDATINGDIVSDLGNLKIKLKGNNTMTHNSYNYLDLNRLILSTNGGSLTFDTDGTGCLKLNDGGSGIDYSFDGFTTVDYINGLSLNSTTHEIYSSIPLWVNGTQVTTANASNVFNNTRNGLPRVSYNVTTSTLTLNGEEISVNTTSGIKSGLTNLNVYLVGRNSSEEMNVNYPAFEGVTGSEKITFQTDDAAPGSLSIWSMGYYKNIEPIYQNGLAFFAKNNKRNTYNSFSIKLPKWSGKGTDSNPYMIGNYTDLEALATFVNNDSITSGLYFQLADDLTCPAAVSVFPSIGRTNSYIYSFDGTFDGNTKTITGLKSSYGLFAFVGGNGVVKNLTLDACDVQGGSAESAAAGLVADIRGSSAKIENCKVVGGNISNGSNANLTSIGGIVGYIHGSTITNCSVDRTTITQGGALTFEAGAGGIAGRTYDGVTISNCSVVNTQIAANTTGGNPVYAGAVVGWTEKDPSFSGNTYNYQVTVEAAGVEKKNNDQRGIGDGADAVSEVELIGLVKLTIDIPSKGCESANYISGFYRVNAPNYYMLPYSLSNTPFKFKATSANGYDRPTLTLNSTGGAVTMTSGPADGAGINYTEWEIQAPNADATGSVIFPINLSNTSRTFTITDPDPIVYNNGTAVDIKEIKTTLNSVDVTLAKGTDYTISGYQDDQGAAITTGAPSDAGNYKVVISAAGDNSGTATIPFTIDQKSVSITAADEAVTYNGTAQNYASATGSGTFVVTYYTTEDDRTNNKNALTSAPTNANTYYVKVSQGDNNYSSADALATFKIDPLTATLNWTNTTFTYDGTAKVPTATVTNLIGTDACDVTVTGAETNASATSYTATATALSNNNYALPSGVTQTFTINPLAATPDVVLTIPTSYVYDGTAKTPAVAVSVSGVALTTDDYSVAYTDNINAGRAAAKATVTLKRNYSGSKVETFDINPLTATLSWGNTTFVYNGTAQAPTATVTNLVGTDVCNVTVGGAETAAGSYTATATALSNANYQLPASSTTTFTILDRTATIDFGDRTFKTYYDANETFIVPDGTTAYIVTGVSGNAVTIQKVSYIKAGVPVLLESTPGSTVAKNVSETFTGNLLKYAAAATPATEKHYLLYKNEFVRASGTISNKVYLDLAGYSGGARSLVIGDGATAIEGIVIDEEDGDAKWYDMQGRRINKPTKAGLYIKDGQKVVVKTRY